MSYAFVLGASGYIGNSVACALRDAGYLVYAAVRSSRHEKMLVERELIPVIGDFAADPVVFDSALRRSCVIVDAVGYSPESPVAMPFFEHVSTLFAGVAATYRPLYIFTSGIMIYASGERVDHLLSETEAPKPVDPIEMLPKIAIEQAVMKCSNMQGVVVRPGFVYGGTGGVIAKMFFDRPQDASEIVVWGSKKKRWSWVHHRDLGRAFALIAQKRATFGNEIFNVAAPGDHPTWEEIICSGARAAGWQGTMEDIKSVPVPEEEKRANNWEWNVQINPAKAMQVLGWTASRPCFLQDVDVYYRSWKAAQ